ncbi:hypothetical protein [Bacteriovorax sp. Seq25_V]|uniref:hypothetical protein n=1 Tax=Bacteriovorax sp. Seq25_V TaxID=1201288 RepID=UPI00038A3F5C|nr:hypothetical protein [Bacteriovorax sp. Seq25_V]EQC43353.1 putative membrane protein [Bacteriovorax sp. Seq25_V]
MFNLLVLSFLILLIVFATFKIFKVEGLRSISIQRYISLSKQSRSYDFSSYIVRVFQIIISLIMFFVIIYDFGESNILYRKISITELLLFFTFDFICLSYLNFKSIKQKIDLLSHIRSTLYIISTLIIISMILHFYSLSPVISQIITKQNQLMFFVPKWNAIMLAPVFWIFILIIKDSQRQIIKSPGEYEIIDYQNMILLYARLMIYGVVLVLLFAGGDTSLGLFDRFNMNSFQLELLQKFVFLVKYIVMIYILKWTHNLTVSKSLSEALKSSRLYVLVTMLTFIIVCVIKVYQL